MVSTNRKWNVLSKLVAPKVMLSVRYITSELEEMEREDNFRLKRFKELKTKKNKGEDDENIRCYCDKKPGKGDDFVCAVCKKEEENRKTSKNVTYDSKSKSRTSDNIGDKPSRLSTANQKRLDDLTAHLEIVISLTNQCKTEGLMSSSADTFVYACKEVRCKLEEIDQPQNSVNTSGAQVSQDVCCDLCKDSTQSKVNENPCDVDDAKAHQVVCCNIVKDVKPKDETCDVCDQTNITKTRDALCKICAEDKQDSEEESDLIGCFETKFKEIVKVIKTRNDDGSISEEKQVITIKTERKHPHKPNQLCGRPCCKIDSLDSGLGLDDKNDKNNEFCCKSVKKTKSEDITCSKPQQSNLRVCISETKNDKKGETTFKANCTETETKSNEHEKLSQNVCCVKKFPMEGNDSDISETSSKNVCCNQECPSQTESSKSKISKKSSQSKGSKSELSQKSLQSICCNTKCPSQTGSSKSKISAKSSKNICCNIKCPSNIGKTKSKESEKSKDNSHICCNKECPSEIASKHSKMSQKSSSKCCKMTPKNSMKDVSCSCTAPTKSACCDPVWKDETSSTTDLTESSEETEEKFICIQDNDTNESENKCCNKNGDKVKKKKSSLNFSIKMCKSKDKAKEMEKCATCNAQSEPRSGECPHCVANSKNNVKSDKCECKENTAEKCSYCTGKGEANPKADECECKEIQGNDSEQCPDCVAKQETKPSSEKCPHCAAKQETKVSSGKCPHCVAKQESTPNPEKCPHCAAKQKSKPTSEKCPQCSIGQEPKPSTGKCPHCAEKQESKPNSTCPHCGTQPETKSSCEKCPHCGAKKESKPTSDKCPHCTTKQESKSNSEKCPQCAAKQDNTLSSGKVETTQSCKTCPHCGAKQESKGSSGKFPHCAAKQEPKPNSGKCPAKQESKSSSGKCPKCSANVETKSSCVKCPHCGAKQETKPNTRCPECGRSNETDNNQDNQEKCCKIRIISKQNDGGKQETVQEFVILGNILEAIKQILLPGTRADDTKPSSDKEAKKSCSSSSALNKGPPRSQSCPVCGKSEQKPTTGVTQRSQSLGNMTSRKSDSSKAVNYDSRSSRNSGSNSCPSCAEESEPYCAVCESLASTKEGTCQIGEPQSKQSDRETKCPRANLKNSQSCPICEDSKPASVRQTRSEESCCSAPKEKLCCDEEVTKKDASTSTRRSDRYDVRSLQMIKPQKKLTCTCQSDSILLYSNRPQDPKKCKSCMSYITYLTLCPY